jgi:TrmH family RNA methyltransferase
MGNLKTNNELTNHESRLSHPTMPPSITSSSNPKIQRVRALLEKRKQREDERAFVVEGVRLVEEALAAHWQVELALFTDQLSARGQDALRKIEEAGAEVAEIPPRLMEQIAGTETPQGLLAILRQREAALPQPLHFVLVADALRDPGNLGTLLRSAAAAGVQAVILAPGTTDAFAPKVLRAGMGAHFSMPLLRLDWEEIRALCKEKTRPALQVYLAEASKGAVIWDADLGKPLALVIGGEAEGVSPQAQALADGNLMIPMPGGSESLNAAVAASVLLFEVLRQRR